MASTATIITVLALAGALASWAAGAYFFVRTAAEIDDSGLKWLAVVWPFAIGRIKGSAAVSAANVNKSLVAFLACVLVAAAAGSVATNLHRIAK